METVEIPLEEARRQAELINKFVNNSRDTKRLYINLNDTAYVIHVSSERGANMKSINYPEGFTAFDTLINKKAVSSYPGSVVIAAIQRIMNTKIEAVEADVPEYMNDVDYGISMNSAVLSRHRTTVEMQEFAAAVLEDTDKQLAQLSPATILFAFVRMYATKVLSTLGHEKYTYQLLGSLPEGNEVTLLAIW